jgi:hypothetical protein
MWLMSVTTSSSMAQVGVTHWMLIGCLCPAVELFLAESHARRMKGLSGEASS